MKNSDGVRTDLTELVAVFTEWDRRYREEPEKFFNEVEHLLQRTPGTYGDGAGRYFLELLREMRQR